MQVPPNLTIFPLHALPDELQAAVLEVHEFIQAPIPLIVAAALAPLSIASQGLFDVRRMGGIESPVSLFLLVIAASGERKSTADTLFRKPLSDFEAAHQDFANKALAAYKPLHRAWKVKLRGIDKAIERAFAKDESTDELTKSLVALTVAEPKKPPPAPSFAYADATTAALQLNLHENVPSAGLISSEAGLIMGGRATTEVAFYNQAWDGIDKFTVVRKAGNFTLVDPRLTISLMAQPGTTRRFFDKKGQQVRDIGLLARMLISFPDSTQGTRFNHSTKPPPWNALLKYHDRINALLKKYYEDFQAGKPKTVLGFTSQADQVCLRFYNTMESEIGKGNLLEDVRDHASKITENLARVAALFHICKGHGDDIDADTTERAAVVCQWYAWEFFRLFGAPNEMSQQHELATQLVADLTKLYQRSGGATTGFRKSDLYHHCHPSLREKKPLEIAINALIARGMVVVGKGADKKTYIALTQNFFPAASVPMLMVNAPQPYRGIADGLVQSGAGYFQWATAEPPSIPTNTDSPLDSKFL